MTTASLLELCGNAELKVHVFVSALLDWRASPSWDIASGQGGEGEELDKPQKSVLLRP